MLVLIWLALAPSPISARTPQWHWLDGTPDLEALLPAAPSTLVHGDNAILAAVIEDGKFPKWASRRLAELQPHAGSDPRSWPLLLAAAGNQAASREALATQRRAASISAEAAQELDLLRALIELRDRRTAEADRFAAMACAQPGAAPLVSFCLHVQALIASASGNRAAASELLGQVRRSDYPMAQLPDILPREPRWDRLRTALFDTGRALYREIWTPHDDDALVRRVMAQQLAAALEAARKDGPASAEVWKSVRGLVWRDMSLGEFRRARLWLNTFRDQVLERGGDGGDIQRLKRSFLRQSATLAATEGDMGAARLAVSKVRALADPSTSPTSRAAELFYMADDVDVPFQPELATALFEEVWTWASSQPDAPLDADSTSFGRRFGSLSLRPPNGSSQWESLQERQPGPYEGARALLFSSSIRLMLLSAEAGDLRKVEFYRQSAKTSADRLDLVLGDLPVHAVVLDAMTTDMIRRYNPAALKQAEANLMDARRRAVKKLRFPEGDPTRLINAWAQIAPKLDRRIALTNTAMPVLDALLRRVDGVLGRSQQELGRVDDAYRTLENAFQLLLKAYGVGGYTTEQVDLATRLAQLATIRSEEPTALKWAGEAIGSQSVLNHGTRAFAEVLQARAELFRRAGDFYGAELSLGRAIAILLPLGTPAGRQLAGARAALAGVLFDEGDVAAALPIARTVTESQAAVTRQDWTADERRGVALHLRALYRRYEASGGEQKKALLREAFTTAQLLASSRAEQAIEAARRREALRDPALEALIQRRDELLRQRAKLDQQFAAVFTGQPAAASQLEENGRKHAALAAELTVLATAIRQTPSQANRANLATSQPLPLDAAIVALGESEALFFFNQADGDVFAWLVTRDRGVQWRRVPLEMAVIERHVATLRCGLDSADWVPSQTRCRALTGAASSTPDRSSLPFRLDAAFALYQALLAPFADAFGGKSLVVVADGALATLPFSTFITERPTSVLARSAVNYRTLPWLVRRTSVSVLPYVGDLRRPPAQVLGQPGVGRFIGFGDPNLRSRPDLKLDDAKGTEATVNAVGEVFQASSKDKFLRESATKAQLAVLNASGRLAAAQIVMFATHALLPGNPTLIEQTLDEPALLLTPGEASPADPAAGLLTASDVAQLALRAEVVILSACNTGGGERRGDEALSGLARAFFYAGARSMLVSQWAANAFVAQKLMKDTFTSEAGQTAAGIAGAFQKAQIALINTSDVGLAHPSSWAVFVVIGRGGIAGPVSGGR